VKTVLAVLAVLIVVAIYFGVYLYNTFNKLVALRNSTATAWAQIDTELQQRLDLIPALVATVKGYAAHEKQTLESVISARSAAVSADGPKDQLTQNDLLAGSLGRLMLLAEAYPNLKADTSFLDLQGQLSQIERRINLARRFYNESVLVYNTSQEQFPANLVAKRLGHLTSQSYSAKPEAAEPPKFEF
jgi:LemA protein